MHLPQSYQCVWSMPWADAHLPLRLCTYNLDQGKHCIFIPVILFQMVGGNPCSRRDTCKNILLHNKHLEKNASEYCTLHYEITHYAHLSLQVS